MISIMSAAAIDPLAPTTLYAWAHGGGVFKSADGGGSWSASATGLMTHTDAVALDLLPLSPPTLRAAESRAVLKTVTGWRRRGINRVLADPVVRLHRPAGPGYGSGD